MLRRSVPSSMGRFKFKCHAHGQFVFEGPGFGNFRNKFPMHGDLLPRASGPCGMQTQSLIKAGICHLLPVF